MEEIYLKWTALITSYETLDEAWQRSSMDEGSSCGFFAVWEEPEITRKKWSGWLFICLEKPF